LVAEEQFDEFGIKAWMRQDFYKAIDTYKEQSQKSGEWNQLDHESQRYINHLLRDFERNGL